MSAIVNEQAKIQSTMKSIDRRLARLETQRSFVAAMPSDQEIDFPVFKSITDLGKSLPNGLVSI